MNEFVETRGDVINNIKTLYNYLRNKDNTELFGFASRIIKNGRVYVVENIDSHICFAPSRFVGYKDNTMEKHKANDEKNGNDTNAVLYSLYYRVSDDRLNSLFQKELAVFGLSSGYKDFWIPKDTTVDKLLSNIGITIKRYWLGRVTSDDYWQQALDNHYWLTQQRYGIQNSTAVTLVLDCVKNIKTDDVILLAYGSGIYAYGNVEECPFESNQVSSLAEVIKRNKHDYKDGIVRFADSNVFYEDLKDGCENWGQRIVVDQWHNYLENTSVTTQGITSEIKQGNQRMSICEVSEKFAIEKINQLKKQFEMKNLFISRISKLLSEKHNIILQGAPGTGKTFLAKQIAAQMILEKEYDEKTASEGEKKKMKEQYDFVQFHPSYDYTDFVEGLRPIKDDDGNIGFERQDGIFKLFCKRAINNLSGNRKIEQFDSIWDILIKDIQDELLKGNLTRIGSFEYGLSSKNSLKYISKDTRSGYSFTTTKENVLSAYMGNKARPSGGLQKYINEVVSYMQEKYGLPSFKERNNISEKKQYVFVIDEINRGEISKIFGELFFSIDPGYRGTNGRVKTQYQNLVEEDDVFYDGFYVPENVYIIGTMNDIDRSVESMDFAFRRRFAFNEVSAKESQQMFDSDSAWGKDENGKSRKPSSEVISDIKKRMDALNDAICPDKKDSNKKGIEGLSSAYHIGASYFLKLANYMEESADIAYKKLWDNHLKGLLSEYLRGMPDAEEKLDTLGKAFGINSSDSNPS